MRVLILALGLAWSGCYSPGVADCQFSCGSGDICPDGTSCMGGVCRTTSTGSCPSGIDAAALDDTSCPTPPQSGCGPRFRLPGGTCALICSNEKWDDAVSMCGSGAWEAGKLDTVAQLDALDLQEPVWIGASRMAMWRWTDGSPIPGALWTGGMAPMGGSTCGEVTALRRLSNANACNDRLPRLCTQR